MNSSTTAPAVFVLSAITLPLAGGDNMNMYYVCVRVCTCVFVCTYSVHTEKTLCIAVDALYMCMCVYIQIHATNMCMCVPCLLCAVYVCVWVCVWVSACICGSCSGMCTCLHTGIAVCSSQNGSIGASACACAPPNRYSRKYLCMNIHI